MLRRPNSQKKEVNACHCILDDVSSMSINSLEGALYNIRVTLIIEDVEGRYPNLLDWSSSIGNPSWFACTTAEQTSLSDRQLVLTFLGDLQILNHYSSGTTEASPSNDLQNPQQSLLILKILTRCHSDT